MKPCSKPSASTSTNTRPNVSCEAIPCLNVRNCCNYDSFIDPTAPPPPSCPRHSAPHTPPPAASPSTRAATTANAGLPDRQNAPKTCSSLQLPSFSTGYGKIKLTPPPTTCCQAFPSCDCSGRKRGWVRSGLQINPLCFDPLQVCHIALHEDAYLRQGLKSCTKGVRPVLRLTSCHLSVTLQSDPLEAD
jgi:hypothetical protein